jgi:transposase
VWGVLRLRQTDMRKSINGLSAIVKYSFRLDPFQGKRKKLHTFKTKGEESIIKEKEPTISQKR